MAAEKHVGGVTSTVSGLRVLLGVLPRVSLYSPGRFLSLKVVGGLTRDGEGVRESLTGTLGSIKARFCMLKKQLLNKLPSGYVKNWVKSSVWRDL